MVARASSGRRRGPRTEHDPLEVSVATNLDHRETRVKTVFGTFQAQGSRLSGGGISTRKLVQHGRERDRGPRRPCGIAVSTVLPSKSSIAPAAEVVASFIEVHEQGRKLGRGPRRPEARSPPVRRSRWSRRQGRPWACRGLEAHDGKGSKRVERHLRPVRARCLAPCRGASSIRRRCVCRAKRIA